MTHLCVSMPHLVTNLLNIVDTENETQQQQQHLNTTATTTPVKHNPLKKQLSTPSRLNAMRKLPTKVAEKLLHLVDKLTATGETGYELWEGWVRGWCVESVGASVGSTDDFFLFSMTHWEEVGIEEESEKGETVASTINVPAQVRMSLKMFEPSKCNR